MASTIEAHKGLRIGVATVVAISQPFVKKRKQISTRVRRGGSVPFYCLGGNETGVLRIVPLVASAVLLYAGGNEHCELPRGKNPGSFTITGEAESLQDFCDCLGATRVQQPCGQREDRPQKVEHSADRDAKDPKWQQEQPDQRIQHQCEDRNRPRDHEQNAPQQKREHKRTRNRLTLKPRWKFGLILPWN